MRTHAEIVAALEARMAELERQAIRLNPPQPENGCLSCKWGEKSNLGVRYTKCTQPLITGFNKKYVWAWDCQDGTQIDAALCGPEKALWESRDDEPNYYGWWIALGLISAVMLYICVIA